jgi:hypothetical protein
MTVSGIGDVVEVYVCEADAAAALAEVLSDEPDWAMRLTVVPIDLGEFVAN